MAERRKYWKMGRAIDKGAKKMADGKNIRCKDVEVGGRRG